jgi:hypothetical protein
MQQDLVDDRDWIRKEDHPRSWGFILPISARACKPIRIVGRS